jgi:type VI secretion system protein ImpA
MDFDLQRLLAPVSDDAPSGPDLSYDPDFLALEQAAQGKPEQQFGETVIPAEEPDWQEVKRRCQTLLTRSKDLRAAVLYARALTNTDQSEGLAAGLELIRDILARYWDSLHPELEGDPENDPTMRLNALGPLADPTTFLREIRNAQIASSQQHGRVAFRDILVAVGKVPPSNGVALSETEIAGVLSGVAGENPEPLQAAVNAARLTSEIEALLGEKGVISQAPDLRVLHDVLRAAVPFCEAALGTQAVADGASAAAPAQNAGAPISSAILTREDAVRALENVCKFMEQAEPSNPAPLLIRRAQRLIGRNFMQIIEELAPESLDQIHKLGGLEKK